jgi:hypothetical protein
MNRNRVCAYNDQFTNSSERGFESILTSSTLEGDRKDRHVVQLARRACNCGRHCRNLLRIGIGLKIGALVLCIEIAGLAFFFARATGMI